jgi:hypothetical protein
MEDFTVDKAIIIQQDQLREWKKVLTPEAYGDLKRHAEKNNRTAKSTHHITRGSDLSVFISNYASQLKPIDNDGPMTKMTAEDLLCLRHGDKVYYGNSSTIRSLNYVGRMPKGENVYLIFSDGEFLMHLYIGRDNTFRGDWFMGKYDSKFVGNYMIDYYKSQIGSVENIYLNKED